MGRKPLAATGFAHAGGSLVLFAVMHHTAASASLLGLPMFGLYGFTISLGPGEVSGSGLLGVELSPTRIRSIAQSVTVGGGRIGASIAAFVFPALLRITGVTGLFYIPEPKGRSLEEINGDHDAAIMPAGAAV